MDMKTFLLFPNYSPRTKNVEDTYSGFQVNQGENITCHFATV